VGRIVISPGLGPFGETLFSFDRRRHRSRFGGVTPPDAAIPASNLARHAAVLFNIDPGRPVLDLFTPVAATDGLDEALDQFMSLPDDVLDHEFRHFSERRALPRWITPLMGTDLHARRLLARAISDAAAAHVTPHWSRMRSFLQAESSAAARRFLQGGLEGLLTELHPCMRWDPPWLKLGCRDGSLDGELTVKQRIILAPAVFCGPHPCLFRPRDQTAPLLVVYPAMRDFADFSRLWHQPQHSPAVARLIGQSRADLLWTIREQPGLAVRDLALAVGISIGTASEHIAVLRDAGLVIGRRQGKAHVHALTVLGCSVLGVG
jgi:DNA-binding transcriptional ArsR family regulator